MTTESKVRAPGPIYIEPWPPDDTEESVLGTDLHQTTIRNLTMGINEAAQHYQQTGGPLPWRALSQIMLIGCRRPDGSDYRTFPDVFVYPKPIDPNRASVTISLDGPPVLIIEVLSEATYAADRDVARGKGYSYARAGVREYLTLDPMGMFVPEGGRAWCLVDDRYEPWHQDDDGRWRLQTLPVLVGPEGAMGTVYTREGRRLLREGEVEETVTRQAEEIEALRRQLRELTSGD